MQCTRVPPPGARMTAAPVAFVGSDRKGISAAWETFLTTDEPHGPNHHVGAFVPRILSHVSGAEFSLFPESLIALASSGGGATSSKAGPVACESTARAVVGVTASAKQKIAANI